MLDFVCAGQARAIMQCLVKCCLRATFSSAVLQLPAKDMQAPHAACGYSVLAQRLTARRYIAVAGHALSLQQLVSRETDPLQSAVHLLFCSSLCGCFSSSELY
jgi:hypothetical protein